MILSGPVKCLTVLQPWASLIAARVKRNETRGWLTKHRGPLAIHSGMRPVSMDDLRLPGIELAMRRHCMVPDGLPLDRFHEYLPLGRILCLADLIACHRTDIMTQAGEIQLTEEFYLGNYGPGRYAFELEVQTVFEPGIPAKGAQGLWTYHMNPTNQKEPLMAKKPAAEKTNMEEHQVKDEKDQVNAAFASGKERPGAPSDPAFDESPNPGQAAEPTEAAKMPDVPTYTHVVAADEFVTSFQKIIFIKFSREDLAVRAEQMAACDTECSQLEMDMAAEMKEWKEKIKVVQGKRIALSAQVTAKGEEREIECRKRINEESQSAIIFNAATLEIVEVKKLTSKELQVEMHMAETHRAAANTRAKPPKGSKLVKGNFPADKVVGANALENSEQDAKNDAAVKNLADESKD